MQKRDFDYGCYIAYVERRRQPLHYKRAFDTAVAAAVARARSAPLSRRRRRARRRAQEAARAPSAERRRRRRRRRMAAAGETLRAKVDRIKASLELATDLSAGIREANALMGLTPDGLSLPEQADRLSQASRGTCPTVNRTSTVKSACHAPLPRANS